VGKALPYAPIFLNDLIGECVAEGLGFRARGILLSLLHVQHLSGAIPADLRAVRRLLGGDAEPGEIKAVVELFFPLTEDRNRRMNQQHAVAREKAVSAYAARVRGGQSRAAQPSAQQARVRGGQAHAAQIRR
jgi:uncharacterized protein YdaU (DUF1376 family)